MFYAACQKIVRPKLKPATSAPVPFVRQMSIPVTKAHVYQTQFAQNKSAHINGDVGPSPRSTVCLDPAGSVSMIPQVNLVAGELITEQNFLLFVFVPLPPAVGSESSCVYVSCFSET